MNENSTVKSKKESLEMFRLGLTLAIFAAVSCTVLAFVNNFTSPKIIQNRINKANAAIKTVFTDAEVFEPVYDFGKSSISTITIESLYVAKKGNSVLGAVAQVSGPTYDTAKIIVGLDVNGLVTGVQFLELTDSPGFGLKANDPTFKLSNGQTFYDQFKGKKAKDGFVAGETFDAISGATITSVGVADLISEGTKVISDYLGGLNE